MEKVPGTEVEDPAATMRRFGRRWLQQGAGSGCPALPGGVRGEVAQEAAGTGGKWALYRGEADWGETTGCVLAIQWRRV